MQDELELERRVWKTTMCNSDEIKIADANKASR